MSITSRAIGKSILLIDSHAVVRSGLRMLLSLRPELVVVGDTGRREEALQLVLDKQADLILLDPNLPRIAPAVLITEIRTYSPRSKLILLTAKTPSDLGVEFSITDVHGYLPKTVTADELINTIALVARGRQVVAPEIEILLLSSCMPEDFPETLLHTPLTKREQEVLALLVTGQGNRDIATSMQVGVETVRTHVKSVLRKLNQSTRTQAVVEALRLGLIEL